MNVRSHEVVLNPDGFFREESERPRLLIPALIVFGVGLVEAGRSMYVSSYTTSAIEAGPGAGGGSGMMYLLTIPSLLVPFVTWMLVTAVLLGVCMYLGGEGEASETLKIAGWGYIPAIVGGVITFAVTVQFLGGTEPSGMQEVIETQTTLTDMLRSTEMRALKYSLVAWQGFIWTFGLKHAQNLELRKAAVPSGVVVSLIVGWDLLGSRFVTWLMGVAF